MQEVTSPLCFLNAVMFHFWKVKKEAKVLASLCLWNIYSPDLHTFKGTVSCPVEAYLIFTFLAFPQGKCYGNNILMFNTTRFIPLIVFPFSL